MEDTKKQLLSNKNSRTLFYSLRRLVTLGGTGTYILWQTGIFENAVTTPTIKISVWIVTGWTLITFIRDYYKRATSKENPDIGQLTRATALFGMVPWLVLIIVAAALKAGVADMFQHLVVLSSLQIGGKVFEGYEMKYDLVMKREARKL